MRGIFQLVNGDDGTRSEPFNCTDRELYDKLNSCDDEQEEMMSRSYVLCVMQDVEDNGEWQYSVFPMLGVCEFMALFGTKFEGNGDVEQVA